MSVFEKLATGDMQTFACCTLLLSFSMLCSCDSKIQLKNFSLNDNRRALRCLESLIDVTDWAVHNFLLIFNEMAMVDDDFFKRYQNFGWNLYTRGNNNLTGFLNVIIFADNFNNLNGTLSTISIRRINSRAKVVINVMEDFASLDEIKVASKGITAEMWKLDKTRVVYLVPYKGDVLVMTYFPFAVNCQAGELEVLYTWRGRNFEKGVNLFPEKMLDIRGCVQNYSDVFSYHVELELHKEFTETGEMILGGVGGRLMTIVAEKMNMTLYLLPEEEESWDVVLNQAITKFTSVAVGKSLFSVSGNIPTARRLKFLDLESSFMEESFGFGYIADGVEVSWKNIVWPLTNEVWGYIGCTLLLFCSLIFLINRRDWRVIAPDKFTILDSFGIFLGSSRVLPRSYYGRYLVGMWIVYSYVINVGYNSGLVSTLTTPKEKQIINTFEELLANGIDFGGGAVHREFYHDSSDPVMMKIYNNFKIWPENESSYLFGNSKGATGVMASFIRLYNINQMGRVKHQVHMLKETAFTFHVPVSMRRGSPFTLGVHRYTSQAVQSGFTDYWLKYYTRNSSFAAIGAKTPSVLSTRHLQGILYLYIAGIICSSIVFLGELIFFHT